MKKIAKVVAVALIVCTLVCLFASCTKSLNGTYESTGSVGSALNGTLTFDRDSNVTGELSVPVIGEISVDGTYVIEDGYITFTYTLLGFSKDLKYSFEKNGNSIIIDGAEFVKQK